MYIYHICISVMSRTGYACQISLKHEPKQEQGGKQKGCHIPSFQKVFLPSHIFVHFWNQEVIKGVWSWKTYLLLFSFESFKAYPSTLPSPHEVCIHFPAFPPTFRSATTEHGSFKLTDVSYHLRFSFVSFACIVRSFFVFRSFAFRSCNWFVRIVYRSFRSSV